jgi:hypothetical protein
MHITPPGNLFWRKVIELIFCLVVDLDVVFALPVGVITENLDKLNISESSREEDTITT